MRHSVNTPRWEATHEGAGEWRVKYIYYVENRGVNVRSHERLIEENQEWTLSPSGIITSQQGIC